MLWHDLKSLNVEGRGWNEPNDFYRRLPGKAESRMSESVWYLSANSSGMAARFVTDSDQIKVRWKLKNDTLALNHMASTGVSGIDLYVRFKGEWRWLGIGRPSATENEELLISGLAQEKREYALYLPLYNGVNSVEIGVSDGAAFDKALPRMRDIKPVVFYGSSITQGACASRPGMAYPAIIGRKLDIPTINLGFSGNGKCEPEVADLLAELDPQIYVIDCMPNMEASYIYDRIRYLLDALKKSQPNTPVVLVEHVIYQFMFLNVNSPDDGEPKNEVLRKVYADVKSDWKDKLYYVKCTDLYGSDGESTVDGVHATDLGFTRIAEVLTPVVSNVLNAIGK